MQIQQRKRMRFLIHSAPLYGVVKIKEEHILRRLSIK
jgi:hypothetical protein